MKIIKKAITLYLVSSLVLTGIGISGGDIINFARVIADVISGQSTADDLSPDSVAPERGLNAPTGEKAAETAASAASGWYCKHTKNGERPPIPAEMSYITEHGGYYLGEDEKVIYLTFDAGYENGNIEKILDTLKAENVTGAFFILDNLVRSNTALVERMANEGHTVCNHTAKHRDMTKMTSLDDFKAELDKMEYIYTELTGKKLSKYYRPPEGKVSEENLEWADSLGYKTIMWSYAYADWDNNNQPDPAKAIEKIISGTHNGEVILLHPTSATNAEILPELIHRWKEMGYRFGTLDELTGDGDNG